MPSTILSDNGVSSGTSGIKTTGSNDGALALQTTTAGGTATTAISIDTSQNVTFAGAVTNPAGTVSAPSITFTGDTNTGIFSPAADTVAVSTGGTERMRIDSSGNLGLGVTPTSTGSSGKSFQYGSNVLLQNVVNSQAMFSYNAIYDGNWKYISANRAAAIRIGAQNEGEITFHVSNAVGTAGGTISSWDSSPQIAFAVSNNGTVKAATTIGVGNATPSTSGAGITFPATQSASTNANTLDDYEEGTWTPVIVLDAGTSTGGSYSGTYIKIGRQVTLTIYADVGTVASTPLINGFSGLPFTSENTNQRGVGAVRETANTGNLWGWRVNANETASIMRRYDNNAALTNNMTFIGTVSYFTA